MTRLSVLTGLLSLAALLAAPAAEAAPARHRAHHRRPPSVTHPQPEAPRTLPSAAGRGGLRGPNEPGRRLMAAMNLLDPEGKGYLTWNDFYQGRTYAGRVFAALDGNGDGSVSRREFQAGGDGLRAAEFARLDRDKSGSLTLAEFQRGWNADMFDALSGGRGYLTAGDLRPGFSRVAMLPPPPSARPAEEAAPPATPGWAHTGNLCWIPLTENGHHWTATFPWGPNCR